jgi:hypothetical protein
VLLAGKVLVGFLRGLLTNLDTPPIASDIRSILVRPHFRGISPRERIAFPGQFIIHSTLLRSSEFNLAADRDPRDPSPGARIG